MALHIGPELTILANEPPSTRLTISNMSTEWGALSALVYTSFA